MKADERDIYEYKNQIEVLKELFGGEEVNSKLNRLNDIYKKTEEKWRENLKRLKGFPVKYLLIAETPPWIEQGEVQYFYNNFEGSWCRSIWRAFSQKNKQPSPDECLEMLAKKGFLLIDTLPFAMKYTSAKRKKPTYKELIDKCLKDFFMKKVHDQSIRYAENVKIAFAFKLNAEAVIEALPKKLKLPESQEITIDKFLIASDRSGFTSSTKLRNIFDLII